MKDVNLFVEESLKPAALSQYLACRPSIFSIILPHNSMMFHKHHKGLNS